MILARDLIKEFLVEHGYNVQLNNTAFLGKSSFSFTIYFTNKIGGIWQTQPQEVVYVWANTYPPIHKIDLYEPGSLDRILGLLNRSKTNKKNEDNNNGFY